MPRHHLAAFFEPRTVLVLADKPLALVQDTPRWLQSALTFVQAESGEPVVLPEALAGVGPDMRLDQAVVCLEPQRLPEALQALKACRPRSLVLLTHGEPSADPVEDMIYCRSWGALNDCAVLGPRAFGGQRPHLGLNLSLQIGRAHV